METRDVEYDILIVTDFKEQSQEIEHLPSVLYDNTYGSKK